MSTGLAVIAMHIAGWLARGVGVIDAHGVIEDNHFFCIKLVCQKLGQLGVIRFAPRVVGKIADGTGHLSELNCILRKRGRCFGLSYIQQGDLGFNKFRRNQIAGNSVGIQFKGLTFILVDMVVHHRCACHLPILQIRWFP